MKMVIRLKQIPVVNLNNNKTMDKYHKLNKIGKCEMIWIQTTGTYTGLMLEWLRNSWAALLLVKG